MRKIDTEKLYVACRVYDIETELEPWVQYESFGKIDHKIYVDPKRVLLIDEYVNGEHAYIEYKSRRVVKPVEYDSSYESESSCGQSLYLSGYPMGPITWQRTAYFDRKGREVQLIVPFNKFIEDHLGISLDSCISLSYAMSLLRLINMRMGKPFRLSYDPEVAAKQITDKAHHNSADEKVKVKK